MPWACLRACLVWARRLVVPVTAVATASVCGLLRTQYPPMGFSVGDWALLGGFLGAIFGVGLGVQLWLTIRGIDAAAGQRVSPRPSGERGRR